MPWPSRSLKMSPFDREPMTSYWCSIVTMALNHVVSEIFNVEKYRDLEITFKSQSRSLKVYHSIDWVWFPILVFYITLSLWDIRLQKCRDLENRVRVPQHTLSAFIYFFGATCTSCACSLPVGLYLTVCVCVCVSLWFLNAMQPTFRGPCIVNWREWQTVIDYLTTSGVGAAIEVNSWLYDRSGTVNIAIRLLGDALFWCTAW